MVKTGERVIAPKQLCLESCAVIKFWEIRDNISLTVQDRDIVAVEDYVACRMEPVPMPLNELEGHFR